MKGIAPVALTVLLVAAAVLAAGCGEQPSREELNEEILVEAIDGNTARIQNLYDEGADLNARDSDGKTPLHLAVENDHPMTVQLLLRLGAGTDARDNRGWVPLHLAAFTNNTQAAKLLLDSGADVNARDKIGWTPLDIAADLRYEEISRLLLERGGTTRLGGP